MKYLVELDIETDDRQAGEKRIIDLLHGVPADENDPKITTALIRNDPDLPSDVAVDV